jgi:ABC-type multidrug transport system ATPase subunit
MPIKTTNLQKQYENGCLAIKDVSFQINRKEILGLLGPNGAGKSTMFSILTSLIYKSNGSV